MSAVINFFIRPLNFDIFCTGKKFLVFNLVSRDLKIKYRRSFFGFFWTILHPLALSGMFYLIFKVIFKASVPHYVPFILSGVIPWTFFSASVVEGTEVLRANAGLLTKVPIPTQVFPFVVCSSNFVTFILSLPVVFTFSLLTGVEFHATAFYLPILCANLFLCAHSISLILSVLYVYLRDLKHAIGLLMQLLFYATPIVYQVEMIPERLRGFLYLNPVGNLFANFHKVFTGEEISEQSVFVSLGWALILLLLGIETQRRFSRDAVELL
jgi:ABC-type polysaccharide/polyol phosphate export permease